MVESKIPQPEKQQTDVFMLSYFENDYHYQNNIAQKYRLEPRKVPCRSVINPPHPRPGIAIRISPLLPHLPMSIPSVV
ncbi:MAG: hypothetical protein AAFQ80_24700 [Cyanobacteria bacterium J06621_8]